MNKINLKFLTIFLFLLVPILSSFISTVHLITFFELGNYFWMSLILAVVYEIGSISSFISPFVFKKINKNLIWTIFILLVFMQILGNVYFSFDFINNKLLTNPTWLNSFQEFLAYFIGSDIALIKIVISCLIGIPIPLISLFFLKSLMEYSFLNTNEYIKENISPIVGDHNLTKKDLRKNE